jgi:hypothetical protein
MSTAELLKIAADDLTERRAQQAAEELTAVTEFETVEYTRLTFGK